MSGQRNPNPGAVLIQLLRRGNLTLNDPESDERFYSAAVVQSGDAFVVVTNRHVRDDISRLWSEPATCGFEVHSRVLRVSDGPHSTTIGPESLVVPPCEKTDLAAARLDQWSGIAIADSTILSSDQLNSLEQGSELSVYGFLGGSSKPVSESELTNAIGALVETKSTYSVTNLPYDKRCLTAKDLMQPGYSGAPVFTSDMRFVGVGSIALNDENAGFGLVVRADAVSDLVSYVINAAEEAYDSDKID